MKFFCSILLCLLILSCSTKVPQLPDKSMSKVERMEKYLSDFEKAGFSGSVLVAEKGEILLRKGYGESDQGKGVPNKPETIFDMGSISKQFTAAAILKLEMQGRLKVEDKASKFLPELDGQRKDITIHQLLTHTAGLPDALGSDEELISRKDYFQRLNGRNLLQAAGEKHLYSNIGYTLLALIIEEQGGMRYEDFLRKELFLPSRMEQTGYILPEWKTDEMAHGYRNNTDTGLPTEQNWDKDGPGLHLKGNGGLLSNVDDMYKWHLALSGEKILSEAAKKKFYTRHTPEEGGRTFYGYGWAIFPTRWDSELITHNGGNGIFFADFLRFIEEDVCIIFFTNAGNRDVERIAFRLARVMFEEKY
ncbi:MAG: serine hydrolase domain-containing protein [Bacteroidota bacterium]